MIPEIKKPDVIIVDDHQTFRQSLASILNIENIANVIGEASDGLTFIKLLKHLKPDLVIMDIDMPVMNGMEATQKALELIPDLKIIAYTMSVNDECCKKMIALGVKGYLLKAFGINELEIAIQQVMMDENYFSNQHPTIIKNKGSLDSIKKLTENIGLSNLKNFTES